MIKAISFDFWGTLAVHNPEYSIARTAYLADLFGLTSEEADARYKSVKRAYDYQATNFGTATTPIVAVKRLIEGMRLTRPTNAVEIMRDLAALARRHLPILGKDINAALNVAANHFTLCITSNTNFIGGDTLRRVLVGIPITHYGFSDEVGLSKPDSDFFRTTMCGAQRVLPALRAHEMVHIGDHEICDIKGAKKVGMEAIFVTDPDHTASTVRNLVKTHSGANKA